METIATEGERFARILVVASDPEWVTKETLEIEIAAIREVVSQSSLILSYKTISSFESAEFIAIAKEFRPDVIHFVRKGSSSPYVRMFDKNGWIRNITAATLANYIRAIEYRVGCILFANCTVWRGGRELTGVANCALWSSDKLGYGEGTVNFADLFYEEISSELYFGATAFKLDRGAIDRLEGHGFRIFSQDNLPRNRLVDTYQAETPFQEFKFSRRQGEGQLKDGSGEIQKKSPHLYRVWFGTNRKLLDEGNSNAAFSSERVDKVSYGWCDVAIPKSHAIGELGEPWWKRFPKFWVDNQLKIHDSKVLEEFIFWETLQKQFGGLEAEDRVLLIFLHGYNVDFAHAALRAAQIGFDLGIRGTTAFFSWPSKFKILGYQDDIASIEASEKCIGEFILNMARESGANKVHLIAHSMGNRGLLNAFSNLFESLEATVEKPFQQIFLAAPDVDVDTFKSLSSVYEKVSQRTTMYVSNKDRALKMSELINDQHRAGYFPPITVVSGVDTVEVSKVDLSLLGHGYVAEARSVLVDMHALMESALPPERRFGLERTTSHSGLKYWRMKK